MKPLSDQLTSAKRELALRRRCYPKWINDGRMTKDIAAHEIECFLGIIHNLEKMLHLQQISEEMRNENPDK